MKRMQKTVPTCRKTAMSGLRPSTHGKMRIAIAAGVMLLAAGHAPGLGLADEEMLTPAPGLHGGIGMGVGVRPEYEGARNKKATLFPRINLLYGDRLFFTGMSAGVNLLHFRTEQGFAITAGPLLALRRGRDEADSPSLNGLGDIDAGLDAGGFARLRLQDWQASVDVRKNVSNSGEGATVNLSASRAMSLVPNLRLRASLETTWASADYMKTFFGIDALQSARSGLAQYVAASGFKDAGISLMADYAISGHWGGFATLRYKRLLGDAADSPLVANLGKENQFSAGIGIQYRF